MSVVINAEAFGRRLKALHSAWKEGNGWGATAIAIAVGAAAEGEVRYHKSSSLHLWLLGYEFTDTVLVLANDELHVLAGQKKVDLLGQVHQACEQAGLALKTHVKPKKEDGSAQVQELIGALRASGEPPVVGTLTQEKLTGAFAETWASALAASGLQTIDVASQLGDAMAVKDADEVKNIKKAAHLVGSALTVFAVPQIESIIDEEKKVRHNKLAQKAEEIIAEPSKINVKLKADIVDVAYPPVFQSGGVYDLSLASASTEKHLHYGVIICALGARYASYCANIARTYFVDPNEQQQAEYAALQEAHAAAVAALVDGAPLSAARDAVVKVLQDKGQIRLLEKLPDSIGAAIGLELQDPALELSSSNQKTAKAGMAFNLALGIPDLTRDDAPDEQSKKYAILIADTVVVKPDGAAPDIATAVAPKDWKEVAYYIKGDDGEADGDAEEYIPEPEAGTRKSARTEHVDFKMREDERRRQKENQMELLERVNQATLQMLSKGGAGGASATSSGRKITDLVAYKSISDMQHNNTLSMQVDHKSECLLVPVYGVLVPFHILTLRNASFNQDGDHAYIRINFNYGPSYEPSVKFPASIFLKELSFRSADVRHAAKVVQEVKALRSAVQQREKERAERATLVQQERLVRSKGRVYALPDVWIRPAFGGKGRKVTGALEAHANGFRYTSPKGEELDVMYRNIKHAFFQPADNEMITLVHFHLINPIMVGKKKTHDVQFYTEVMDSVQTLDAGRRSMYDPDEIEEEQRERERRNQINRQFNQFVKRVQADVWERDYGDLNLEFEVPFRDLGFFGVPARSNCFIMPTVNCLVELTELPFTVITLPEVNLVSLERVGFNLRNFDMILIWKDLNKDVARIDSIPSKYLDTIKDWLTSIDIKYYESKVNLNWKNILKSIKEDPEGFVEAGGWNFLDAEQSDSEEDDGEEESDFAPSGDEDESGDEESSEDESLVESDDDDDGSDFEVGSEEEEGLDWDELEEQARREDKERHYSDEEEDKARKRKHAGGGGDRKKAKR